MSQEEVQAKEEGKRIYIAFHVVVGADGEVEGGVSVVEAVGAGGFSDR